MDKTAKQNFHKERVRSFRCPNKYWRWLTIKGALQNPSLKPAQLLRELLAEASEKDPIPEAFHPTD